MIAISHHEGISLNYWVDYNRSKRNIYFVKYTAFPTFHINLQLMQQMSIFKNIFRILMWVIFFFYSYTLQNTQQMQTFSWH